MVQRLKLAGDVPDGWISVDPAVVNEDGASMVLLRRVDLDRPFTTNITVSEQAGSVGEELSVLAEVYRQGLVGQTSELTVLREGLISEPPSRQYAQELHFTANLGGADLDIKQAQFLLEIPTEEPTTTLLLQLLYTAPADVYDIAKSALVEFMGSLSAGYEDTDETAPGRPETGAAQPVAVSKQQLEARVKQILEQSVGQTADAVVCNGDLRAAVGAVQRCALSAGGDKLGVTVTVVNVDGGNVKFDVQVDDQPMV